MRIFSSLALSLTVFGLIAATTPAFAGASRIQAARPSASVCNFPQINEQIRQNPRNANAYVTRAACYLMPMGTRKPPLHNVQAAVTDLETALKLDPRNYYAHHNYANAAYLLGYDDFAITEFNKAIALNPQGARSYLGRGWARWEVCQVDGMTADFAQAVRLDPFLRSEAASPLQIAQRRTECARRPAPSPPPRNCPRPNIVAFSLNARIVLENEWKAQHPGCPVR